MITPPSAPEPPFATTPLPPPPPAPKPRPVPPDVSVPALTPLPPDPNMHEPPLPEEKSDEGYPDCANNLLVVDVIGVLPPRWVAAAPSVPADPPEAKIELPLVKLLKLVDVPLLFDEPPVPMVTVNELLSSKNPKTTWPDPPPLPLPPLPEPPPPPPPIAKALIYLHPTGLVYEPEAVITVTVGTTIFIYTHTF